MTSADYRNHMARQYLTQKTVRAEISIVKNILRKTPVFKTLTSTDNLIVIYVFRTYDMDQLIKKKQNSNKFICPMMESGRQGIQSYHEETDLRENSSLIFRPLNAYNYTRNSFWQ